MTSTVALVANLMDAFPLQKVTTKNFEAYVRDLSDLPTETLGEAVKQLIRTSEFFPTIRAIRETAAEITLDLPSEDQALSQVQQRISWASRDETSRGDPPPIHPEVRAALEHVGGFFAFRSTPEPSIVRGQFLRIYRETRARLILDVQTGDFRKQVTA